MSSATFSNSSMQGSLTTEPDRFSDDAWNLLLASQDVARRWRHGHLDVEHLFLTLFTDRAYKHFIESLSLNQSVLVDRLEGFLADQAMSRGESLIIGDDLEDLLENADHFRNRWGSRLIEISHILMAIGRDQRIGSPLLDELGLPSERLEAELQRAPKPSRRTAEKSSKQYAATTAPSNPEISQVNPTNTFSIPETEPKEADASSKGPSSLQLQEEPKALESYGRDLTSAAQLGQLDPVIGRDSEIRSLIKVLCRKGKNNPVLIGAPGVGKTAIAEL